jgi:hypothetical protein
MKTRKLYLIMVLETFAVLAAFVTSAALFLPKPPLHHINIMVGIIAPLAGIGVTLLLVVYTCKRVFACPTWREAWIQFKLVRRRR